MLSRLKPAVGPGASTPGKEPMKKKKVPKLDDFLDARDYTGAITLLEVSTLQRVFWLFICFIKVVVN